MTVEVPPRFHPISGDPRVGIRKTSAIISITNSATANTIYQAEAGESVVIRKIFCANRTGAQRILTIGDGLAGAFVQRLPIYFVPNNSNEAIEEDLIPRWEFPISTDITAQVDASAAAPNEFQIMLEVECFR